MIVERPRLDHITVTVEPADRESGLAVMWEIVTLAGMDLNRGFQNWLNPDTGDVVFRGRPFPIVSDPIDCHW